jgi:hypothetical protein
VIEVRHNATNAAWSAVDADLLHRVRKTSIIVGLVLAAPVATYFGLMAGAGWIAGIAWSLVNLGMIGAIIRRVLADGPRNKSAIAVVLGIKFPLLYAVGLGCLAVLHLPAAWLVAGFTWPLFVAVMKAAGRLYLGLDESTARAGEGR